MLSTQNQTNITSSTQFDSYRYRPQRGLIYTNYTGADITLTSGQIIKNNGKYNWNSVSQLFEEILSSLPYILNVLVSDWIVSGSVATITILGTTHGKGTNISVKTYETISGSSVENECEVLVDNLNGNATISITNTTQFDGKIVIS
jgi:hypothetical protein